MLRSGKNLIDHLLILLRHIVLCSKFHQLGDEFEVEVMGNVIHAMPMGVIRSLHGSTVTGATSLMMPELPPMPTEVGMKGRAVNQTIFFRHAVHHLSRLGKLFIIGNNQGIKLGVEIVYLLHCMAGLTCALHVITTIFPGNNLGNLLGGHGFFQFAVFQYIGLILGFLSGHGRDITWNIGNGTVIKDDPIQLNGNLRPQGPGNTITNIMGVRSYTTIQFHISTHMAG